MEESLLPARENPFEDVLKEYGRKAEEQAEKTIDAFFQNISRMIIDITSERNYSPEYPKLIPMLGEAISKVIPFGIGSSTLRETTIEKLTDTIFMTYLYLLKEERSVVPLIEMYELFNHIALLYHLSNRDSSYKHFKKLFLYAISDIMVHGDHITDYKSATREYHLVLNKMIELQLEVGPWDYDAIRQSTYNRLEPLINRGLTKLLRKRVEYSRTFDMLCETVEDVIDFYTHNIKMPIRNSPLNKTQHPKISIENPPLARTEEVLIGYNPPKTSEYNDIPVDEQDISISSTRRGSVDNDLALAIMDAALRIANATEEYMEAYTWFFGTWDSRELYFRSKVDASGILSTAMAYSSPLKAHDRGGVAYSVEIEKYEFYKELVSRMLTDVESKLSSLGENEDLDKLEDQALFLLGETFLGPYNTLDVRIFKRRALTVYNKILQAKELPEISEDKVYEWFESELSPKIKELEQGKSRLKEEINRTLEQYNLI